MKKSNLDALMIKYNVQPVGLGYIDCIVSFDNVYEFIDGLSDLGVQIYGITWWCHCKNNDLGCPHGMGGPLSKHYDGYFSEMWFDLLEFSSNEQVIAYLKSSDDKTISKWFGKRLECFVPALWLTVPD